MSRFIKAFAWSVLIFNLCTVRIQAQTIVLDAFKASGYDPVWTTRGKNMGCYAMALKGTGKPISGKIWFNNFAGPTGTYKLSLNVCTESDGASPYKIYANGTLLYSGKFQRKVDCQENDRWRSETYQLGNVKVPNGAKIEFWGQSVYPCGSSHGAYCAWQKMTFVKVDGSIDDPVPALEYASAKPRAGSAGCRARQLSSGAVRIGISPDKIKLAVYSASGEMVLFRSLHNQSTVELPAGLLTPGIHLFVATDCHGKTEAAQAIVK